MPGTIAAIAFKITGSIIIAAKAAAVAKVIIYMAISAGLQKAFGPKIPKSDMDNRREITYTSAIENRYIVYGEVVVGGLLTYFQVAGSKNKDLWTVVTYGGHSCNDITAMFFDDSFISAADIGAWSEGSAGKAVEGGDYFIDGTAYAHFYKHLGDAAQTHNTALAAAVVEWGSVHDGEQVTYGITKITIEEASQKIFEQGSPQSYKALVEGKDTVYSPVSQFAGGTVTQASVDQSNSSYQIYTDNPILAIADYHVDDMIGMGFVADKIDWQTILDEAAYCNYQVPTSTTDVTENRFTCNVLMSTGDDHQDNIFTLLTACNGRMGFKNGRYFIRAGRYGIGANLVSNGTFPNTTGWTKQGNGTMSTSGGQLLLTNTTGGNVLGVTAVSTTIGNIYSVTAHSRTSSNEANNYQLLKSDNANGSSPDVTHTKTTEDAQLRIEFIATATTSYIGLKINSTTDTKTAEFDDVEMYLVSETLINETWLRDDIGISRGMSKEQRFNNARGFYSSEDEQWKKIEAMEVRNTAFESRDNGERLYESFDLPCTNHEDEAQRLLHKYIQQTDEQITLQLLCNYKGLQVAIHDFVHVTISELGFTNKVFRVVQLPISQDDGVDLTLQEDSIDAYQDPDLADYSVRSPSGITFGTAEVPEPTSVTATSKEGGNLIEWVNPLSQYFDVVEVWAHTSASFGAATKIHEGRLNSFLHKLDAGEQRYYWVRAKWAEDFSSEVASSPTNVIAGNKLGGIGTGANVNSPIVGVIINKRTFSGGASNGDLYIHGWNVDGNAVDENAKMWIDGVEITINKGSIYAGIGWGFPSFLAFSPDGNDTFAHGGTQDKMALIRWNGTGWEYDKDGTPQAFTPHSAESLLILGRVKQLTTIGNFIESASISLYGMPYTIAKFEGDFDARTNRDSTAVVDPTIASDGTAIDHTITPTGDANISFEWSWGGTESDIDGFIIYARSNTSSSSYNFGTTPATETAYIIPRHRRAHFILGIPSQYWYTFGVQAFRAVDFDINVNGQLTSTLIQPSLGAEDPYRPNANIAYAGNIIGTVGGKDVDVLIIDNTYSAGLMWTFSSTVQDWVMTNGTLSHNSDGTISLNATSSDPNFRSPTISLDGGMHQYIRVRIKRTAGSGWDGKCFYTTSGHGESESYKKTVPDTTIIGTWVVVDFDMTALTSGGNDWVTSTITALRLDLGLTSSDDFDIDWIGIGRKETGGGTVGSVISIDTYDSDGNLLVNDELLNDLQDWNNISGVGIPDDDATVGAIIGTNLTYYQEATWTPTLIDAGGTPVGSYNAQQGHFTRVGDLMRITGYVGAASIGSVSGTMKIGGLPAVSVNVGNNTPSVTFGACNHLSSLPGNTLTGTVDANATQISIGIWTANAGTRSLLDSDMIFSGSRWFWFSAVYQRTAT